MSEIDKKCTCFRTIVLKEVAGNSAEDKGKREEYVTFILLQTTRAKAHKQEKNYYAHPHSLCCSICRVKSFNM